MKITGRAHVYGANVDTDAIIPARYLDTTDAKELASHCMEPVDPEFITRVQPGDVMVATTNFGCGSSREQAPIALKAAGIGCVIANNFARIFYRNAINQGLPILESDDGPEGISAGDQVEVDLDSGIIRNLTTGATFQGRPFPDFAQEIIQAGGVIEYTRRKLAAKKG